MQVGVHPGNLFGLVERCAFSGTVIGRVVFEPIVFLGFDAVQWTGSVTYSHISSDDASMTISALSVTYMDWVPDL